MRIKIYALVFCLCLAFMPATCYASEYSEDISPVKTEITSDVPGNNFAAGEKSFTISLSNTGSSSENVKLTTIISDQKGNVLVTSNEEQYTLAANEVKPIELIPTVTDNGLYTLTCSITLSGDTYEKSVPFAIIADNTNKHNPYFGVASKLNRFSDENNKNALSLMRKAGMSSVRADFTQWAGVESAKGQYNSLTRLNSLYALIEGYGIENVSANLGYSNELYHTGKVDGSEATIEGFGNYCAYLAEGAGDNIYYYEMWNEFNAWANEQCNGDRSAMADIYIKLLAAAHNAVKTNDTEAKIISMCTSMSDIDFIRAAFEKGAYKYSDIISIHPYIWGDYDKKTHLNEVGAIRDLIKEYTPDGQEPLPLWFTEIGWPTNTSGVYGVSEDKQAEYLVKMTIDSIGNDLCEKIFWYDFVCDGTDMSEKENNFGLLRSFEHETPLAAKKSYVAAAGMNNMLYDAEYSDKLQYDEDITIYRFNKQDGNQLLAMWCDNRDEEVRLDLGAENITCYDMLANVTDEASNENGKYTISVGNDPIYVVGKFKKLDKYVDNAFDTELEIFGNTTCTDKENAEYTISAVNKSSDRVYADLSVKVSSDIYSQTINENVLLLPNGRNLKSIKLPILAPGEYVVEASLSAGDFVKTKNTTLTVTETTTATRNVEYSNGIVTISGTTEKAGATVGVLIKSNDKIAYVEQLISGENRVYSTQAKIPENDTYYVFIYDGTLDISEAFDIKVDAKIMRGSDEIKDIKTLQNGDNVNLCVTVKDNGVIGSEPCDMYCIVQGTDTVLNAASRELIPGQEMIIPFEIKNASDIKSFNIFLWDKVLRPYTYKFELK